MAVAASALCDDAGSGRSPRGEMANGIDRLGRPWGRSAPSFFRRSSHEVCDAITALDDPRREAILEGQMARISPPRLRQAFQAAVHPERRTLEDSSRGKQ